MSTHTTAQKVLRIGILRGHTIVEERLFNPSESVWIDGSDARTATLTKSAMNGATHLLLQATERGYELQFTASMKGKISTGGTVISLQKFAGDPLVKTRDGVTFLPIAPQDRGKITIGDTSILFQFVAPPPNRALASLPKMDFRPRLLEDDDPAFIGFLGVWSSLAFALMIWVWNSEPVAYELTDLPERITKLTVIPHEPPPKEIEELKDLPEVAVVQKVEPRSPTQPSPDTQPEKLDVARREQKLRDQVLRDSKLFAALIGTEGESQKRAAQLWSGEDVGLQDLDAALASAGGITTNTRSEGPRGGGTSHGEAATIDDLVGVGGGEAASVDGPAVKVTGSVLSGTGNVEASEGDASEVEKTIRKYAGQLNYCYEKRLKALPELSGRVEVHWEVVNGAVSGSPQILANTTGDEELATCVQQRIRRWRFEGFDGAANNPFIFEAK